MNRQEKIDLIFFGSLILIFIWVFIALAVYSYRHQYAIISVKNSCNNTVELFTLSKNLQKDKVIVEAKGFNYRVLANDNYIIKWKTDDGRHRYFGLDNIEPGSKHEFNISCFEHHGTVQYYFTDNKGNTTYDEEGYGYE